MKRIFPHLLLTSILLLHGVTSMGFTLTSTAFKEGEIIPVEYTCEGKDSIPPLAWSDPPQGTQSFAMIMDDPDAPIGVWVHWVVFNIPSHIRAWTFDNMNPPQGSVAGNNTWGVTGYGGPCPPPGKNHHYIFALYALDTSLSLPEASTANEVREAIKGHILGQTKLIGLYSR